MKTLKEQLNESLNEKKYTENDISIEGAVQLPNSDRRLVVMENPDGEIETYLLPSNAKLDPYHVEHIKDIKNRLVMGVEKAAKSIKAKFIPYTPALYQVLADNYPYIFKK